MSDNKDVTCSFCNRHQRQCTTVVSSPGDRLGEKKYLCNFCNERFNILLQQNSGPVIASNTPLK